MKKSTKTTRRQPKPAAGLPKTKPAPDSSPDAAPPANHAFPIVGIGASAGGLEALDQFLRPVPPDCGMAFVIVTHLDPTHKDMMVELLQRVTAMPVLQINDRMTVEPGHVYVLPPNRDLSILHGVLHLLEPAAPRGLRLPIDFFLRSLAQDQEGKSIGVILSGMGSDGTLGLRAIKEKAGAVFVQTPATTKFDGMPRSAIDAGLADVIAPAEELAGKIVGYLQHVPLLVGRTDLKLTDMDLSGLEKVVLLVRLQTGQDFLHYKKGTIYRRIARRMGLLQISRIADYVQHLRENPPEANLLCKDLLIGVTSFFRDTAVWEQLKTEVIPELLASRPKGGTLRAWVAGCSTGEEAYSLAISFHEALEQLRSAAHYSLQIFATDLDKDAVDKARAGRYPANIAVDVSDEHLRRYFDKEEHGYRISKHTREMVVFAAHNLIMDPPFTKLDILACRNLLIYLDPDLQKKLLPLFHYSLNPGGFLVLGSSETVSRAPDLYTPLPGKAKLYRRRDTPLQAGLVEFPSEFTRTGVDTATASTPLPPALPSSANLQALTDALLLRRYSPAAVLTTDKGDIIYISGEVGKYLEVAAGKANLNLFAMARRHLRASLNAAFQKAIRQKTTVTLKGEEVGTNGDTQVVDLTVTPLSEPAALKGMVLIVFSEVARLPVAKAASKAERTTVRGARLAALAQELRQSREELQTTREEMQTSSEELKSANEELQSMNEEMQSTNEELITSREEMQSMNEELQTVNHELRAKLDELTRASDDMKNLLNSTEIATVFLDVELRVRSFTAQTASIIHLIPVDAGRPVTDIVSILNYAGLAEDAREVLRSLVFRERRVSAKDGRWFTIRIMPYRTQDNRIDGVVITFVDISESKALEATLREALSVLQTRVTDDTAELDKARVLEDVSRKAQAVLEKRLADQGAELHQAHMDLQTAGERPLQHLTNQSMSPSGAVERKSGKKSPTPPAHAPRSVK